MPQTIPDHFTTEFAKNFEHGVQQRMSRIESMVMTDTVKGKEKRYNRLEKSDWRPITARKAKTTPQDEETNLRWVRMRGFDNVHLLDEWDADMLGEVVLPTSELMQNHQMGYGRLLDKVIVDAALGSAITGADGTTLVPLSNSIAVDYVETGSTANSGLTIAKLRAAKFTLDDQLDPEDEMADERTLIVTAKQLQDLLRTTEVTNADYANVKALVNGQIDTFLGFKFRRFKGLPKDTNTDIRTCVAFTKSAIKLVKGRIGSKLSIRDDMNEAIQARSKCLLGAVRYWEEGVVSILCDESP